MERRLVFDLRYSADTVRDICNRYLEALDPSRFRRETVILKGPRQHDAEQAIPADACHWLELDRTSLRGDRRAAAAAFARLCARKAPDIVIAHRFKAISIMARAMHHSDFQGFGVMHGIHQMDRLGRRLFARTHLRDPVHLIGISEAVTADLRRVCGGNKRNLQTLPNCVDDAQIRHSLLDRKSAREALKLPEDTPVVGSIARLVATKDQATLINAFARLSETIPDAHLCIIGDGPLRQNLQQQVTQLGLQERVHFPGWIDEAHRLLAALDLFALTSVAEGFGLALAEAMAAGVPVVTTDAGGMSEILDGIQPPCPVGDASAIARAMAQLLSMNRTRRDALGLRLRTRVTEQYSVGVFRQRLNSLLDTDPAA